MARTPNAAREDSAPVTRTAPTGEERTTREQESREYDRIHEEWDDVDWRAPRLLDAPPPLPHMDQRWVATMENGEPVPQNVAKRMNEGWRPRPADSVPQDYTPPTISHGEFTGCIGVVGMVLMHRPKKISERFAAKVQQDTRRQMEGVNAALGQVHKPGDPFGRPQLEGKTSVERGRSPVVADDDD